MKKVTLKIEGMACGMCEAHMNDAIKAAFKVKKVVSSHEKNVTVILSDAELDRAKLEATVTDTGYKLISVTTEPYKKKFLGIFGK